MAGAALAQPAGPTPGGAAFKVFLRGTQIGREQATLSRSDSGWILTSSGNTAAPIDLTINRFEVKYTPDWQPLEMTLEARLHNAGIIVRTSFAMTTAINEITQNNATGAKNDQVSARTIVMPNNVFGSYEALAARLWETAVGAELPVYVAPQAEIKVKVLGVSDENLTGPSGSVATRKFDLEFANPSGPLKAVLVVDSQRRMVRFEIPSAGLLVVREDEASVAVRAVAAKNPTDADVSVPANGFNLAGTLTTPPAVAGRLRYPAVVLIGGTAPADRDEVVSNVPVFAGLAKLLADSGHVVLRYDRRGTGQSGGRTETATLTDYAEDAIAAVKWLSKRDDVDKHRLVVAGYRDGAPVALIAAARNKDIDGVITIDATADTGAETILRQQEHVLDGLKLPPAERQARIDLQKQIQAAVVSGKGWEGVPPQMRRQADTAWFKSVLTFDPSTMVPKIRQPMLIIQADRDTSVPSSDADRLGELAKSRKKQPLGEVAHLPDVDETLSMRGSGTVSPEVAAAVAQWIKKL